MITIRAMTIFIMVTFMFMQAYMFGLNDMGSLALMLISVIVIFNTILKLQLGNRRAIRAKAKKDSWLYRFLSKESSLWMKIVSLFSSIIFAVILTVVLKGIIISHGYVALFLIIISVSFVIFGFLREDNTTSSTVSDNLQSDIANHANNVLHIFIVAVLLNVILALLLSAHDTMFLLNSDITFLNFDNIAVHSAVEKTDSNHFTRLMINLYLLLDTFKLAVTTKIIDVMIPGMNDRVDLFYLFYGTIFLLNMMKLFGFSIAFVLFQKGLEVITDNLVNFLNKYLEKTKEWYKEYKTSKEKESPSDSSKGNDETNL